MWLRQGQWTHKVRLITATGLATDTNWQTDCELKLKERCNDEIFQQSKNSNFT